MFLPSSVDQYTNKSYWDQRFIQEETYDWLCSFKDIKKLLFEQLGTQPTPDLRILVLGCGNSMLSQNLFECDFTNITNVDYSESVIRNMKRNYPHMNWKVMDICDMSALEQHSFDVVLEKATLDSLMVKEKDPWKISLETLSLLNNIFSQISTLLRKEGKFISLTWSQPHFRKRLLAKERYDWDISVNTFGTGFEYFMYTMTKGKPLSAQDLLLGRTKSSSTVDAVPLEPETPEEHLEHLLAIDISE